MPISNKCTIKVTGENGTYSGHMVNISANGFAFAVRDSIFANSKGKNLNVKVEGISILDKALEGCIIRSSNNEGEYIVGCRMPEDSEVIKKYVSKNYCE
jgi:hypothetical protein